MMSPLVGASCPAIIRNVVVLPQPDGPSRQQYLPPGISAEIASTATVRPKVLVSSMSRTSDDAVIIGQPQAIVEPARCSSTRAAGDHRPANQPSSGFALLVLAILLEPFRLPS